MKIYHYTKSIKLNSIFEDGFIATEMQRTLNSARKKTDVVWLTEKSSYPKTALPCIPQFSETNLITHIQYKGLHVDLDKIGAVLGKFYRFSFDSSDSRIKPWFYSKERNKLKQNHGWLRMEAVANKVGDDVRSFWFSTNQIELENFGLEVFDGGWKRVLENTSISQCNSAVNEIIERIRTESISKCMEFGIPHSSVVTV